MKLLSKFFGLHLAGYALLCSIFSASTGAFAFGSPGMSGQSGSSGFSGDKGPDASVIANGESQSQYLTGDSGSPGGNGGNIFVYYNEPQNIRNIYVHAGPGRGAIGGQGSLSR